MVWFGVEFALNASANLEAQNLRFGLRFLNDPAGFGISQTLISSASRTPMPRVFFVGLLNTLLVSVLGIVFATILGFVIGLARLSPTGCSRVLPAAMWSSSATCRCCSKSVLVSRRAAGDAGPAPEHRRSGCNRFCCLRPMGWRVEARCARPMAQGWRGLAERTGAPAVYLNNRGLIMPRAVFHDGSGAVVAAFVVVIIAVIGLRMWARRRQETTGRRFPVLWT